MAPKRQTSKKASVKKMQRIAIQAGETKSNYVEVAYASPTLLGNARFKCYWDPIGQVMAGAPFPTQSPGAMITTGTGYQNITGDKFFHLRSKIRFQMNKIQCNSANSPNRVRLIIGYTKESTLGGLTNLPTSTMDQVQLNHYTVLYDQVQEFRTLEDHFDGTTHNRFDIVTFDVDIPNHYNLHLTASTANTGRLFAYVATDADFQGTVDTDEKYTFNIGWQMWFKEV